MGSSAVYAISFSGYILLIGGFFGFSSLFNSRALKLLFAVVWFLPFQAYVDLLRFPIGIQYGLLGIGIFLIKLLSETPGKPSWKFHLNMILIVLVFIIAAWVSDFIVVNLVSLGLSLLIFQLMQTGRIRLKPLYIIYILSGLVLGMLALHYAKGSAGNGPDNYMNINSIRDALSGIVILMERLKLNLLFKSREIFLGIYSWISLIFLLYFILTGVQGKSRQPFFRDKWQLFFLADTILVTATLLFSAWVLANRMGRWYFVAVYISANLFILLSLDRMDKQSGIRRRLLTLFTVVVLTGAVSPVYNMIFHYPGSLRPKVKQYSEFLKLGNAGVIGSYWHGYIVSVPDPDRISSTPHDRESVRSFAQVERVLQNENIYLIRDSWLESFPDSIMQFGRLLVRSGEEFNMAGCNMCLYHKAIIPDTTGTGTR